MVTYETAISFRFPGGEIEQAREQAGKWRSSFGVIKKKKKNGENGKGHIRSQFRSLCVLFWKRALLDDYSWIIAEYRWLIHE